jgi:hypothetical protein
MIETLVSLPASFWVVVATLAVSALWARDKIRSGIGVPMLAVLGTIAVWYVTDLFYNGYEHYTKTFSPETLSDAWWQVALFLTFFSIAAPFVHQLLNARDIQTPSAVLRMWRTGVDEAVLQQQLKSLLRACMWAWSTLAVIAAVRLGPEIPFYFFPFLSHRADPWARGQLGSGFDSLISVADYLGLFLAACFGILAALLKNPRARQFAILGCAVTWPYFIFDRVRNAMLAAILPGILAWAILRVRGWWVKKAALLAGIFLLVNLWFGFVIANRDGDLSIVEIFQEKGLDVENDSHVHHEGLNMFEELCWINSLINTGNYQPNWGESYRDELLSPIPRVLWPGKPMVGFDYAIARGQSRVGDAGAVSATIATGMIGQGVVAFGQLLGPPFAALLMGIWVAILARLDLRGKSPELYGLGLILTFNLGRDISMITLDSLLFGALTLWAIKRAKREKDEPNPLEAIIAGRRDPKFERQRNS